MGEPISDPVSHAIENDPICDALMWAAAKARRFEEWCDRMVGRREWQIACRILDGVVSDG